MNPFLIKQNLIILFLSLTLISCGGGGGGPGDSDRPTISGAIAQSNTYVLVSYSEAMGVTAEDAGNYSIVIDSSSPGSGGLTVYTATLSTDKTSVVLKTSSQVDSINYRVTAVNVRDLAGNVMEQSTTGSGGLVDPASAVFAGVAPSLLEVTMTSDSNGIIGWQDLNANGVIDVGDGMNDSQGSAFILKDTDGNGVIDNWQDLDASGDVSAGDILSGLPDTDLDGLMDYQESQGWTVNIIQLDGSVVTKTVTSNELLADTDGDNLSDFEEFTNNADPRNADTDGDNITDYDEWNVVFSSMTDKDSDNDGLPDLDEYSFYFTSPVNVDTDGDGISDADEIDNNRNPRIADRPKFSIDVQNVNLILDETYSYVDETQTAQEITSSSTATLNRDSSVSNTKTDAGVSESTGNIESSLEAGFDYTQTSKDVIEAYVIPPWKAITTISGGKSWTDSSSWQAEKTDVQSASQTYEDSFTKGETLTSTSTFTRNVNGGRIALSVDIVNKGGLTLTFNDIQISVLKYEKGILVPITTLSLPSGYGAISVSPLNALGTGVIFEASVEANVVEELMKNTPALEFRVANYSLVDIDGVSYANTDESVFNKTAGIVFDYGNTADAERHLVSVAGSNDSNNVVGGGWQGGVTAQGLPRGVSLDYAMQSILGLTRHYRYDTLEAGVDGVLDTVVDSLTDDILEGSHILPGANGWIDTQPAGDDVVVKSLVDRQGSPALAQQGVIAGSDGFVSTEALGDDVQVVNVGEKVPYGTIVVSAGDNNIIDSIVDSKDILEYVGGYETSRTCLGNASTVYAVCTVDSDCNTALETNGSCKGPERIARINTLRAGDYNRDWFVLMSEDIPTAANFNQTIVKPGQVIRLAFLQDLDKDGLSARTEAKYGSVDSSINEIDNNSFGPGFDRVTELANGPGTDVFADSKDTDGDGINDYAEIKVGWKVNLPTELLQVYSHPGLTDSDGDGLSDFVERDLSSYCKLDGSETRTDALCSFTDSSKTVLSTTTVGATHPRLKDTDNDGLSDSEELTPYATSRAIVDGGNGIAESGPAQGSDDQALIISGSLMKAGGIVVAPGLNRLLQSTAGGDDTSTVSVNVMTDPLRPDTDGDNISDGYELVLGTNPAVQDAQETADSDNDGLTDYVENLGWNVTLNGKVYKVYTDPIKSDTDGDGLPDLVERESGSSPVSIMASGLLPAVNGSDSDGDGLTDYQEFTNFSKYINYEQTYSGFSLVDDGLTHYSSYPFLADSDGDTLSDGDEVNIHSTNPRNRDTDGDILSDDYEVTNMWTVALASGQLITGVFDPNAADGDGDGLIDYVELIRGTNPTLANTDGDVYGVNDKMELDLGTDPRDPDDRCVEVAYKTVKLNSGTISYDNGGYITGNYSASLQDRFGVDKNTNYINYNQVEQWFSTGWIWSFPTTVSKHYVMKSNDRVRLYSERRYLDYYGAAWSGWGSNTTFVHQTDFNDPADTEVVISHPYTYGYINIGTAGIAKLINNTVAGTCL
ncbi:MAG: hypothetical protein OEY29_15210 [Gammaproteobacteria bacterium]|nr:hypothetical protein [Gammaproteobacteria bacterium]